MSEGRSSLLLFTHSTGAPRCRPWSPTRLWPPHAMALGTGCYGRSADHCGVPGGSNARPGSHLLHSQPRQGLRGRRALAVGVVPHGQARLDGGVHEARGAQVQGATALLPVRPPRLRPRRRGLGARRRHTWGASRRAQCKPRPGTPRPRTRRDGDVSPPGAGART